MTDEELIAKLRGEPTWGGIVVLTKQDANRIEALTAELATCKKYRDAYAECDRIGTQAVRDLEAKLAKAEAEAKKYKHAFAAQSRKLQAVLHIEGVKATLAEIKGGNDAESNL
jgi:hypothetical protein